MYSWAVNQVKLERAIKWANDEKKAARISEVTEDIVKDRYVEYGGLLKEELEEIKTVGRKPKKIKKVK